MGRTTYLPSRTPAACATLSAVNLRTELNAFFIEHRRWGALDADGDDAIVWIACDGGARMARRVDESDHARH
jgi:hypothetical protein